MEWVFLEAKIEFPSLYEIGGLEIDLMTYYKRLNAVIIDKALLDPLLKGFAQFLPITNWLNRWENIYYYYFL